MNIKIVKKQKLGDVNMPLPGQLNPIIILFTPINLCSALGM